MTTETLERTYPPSLSPGPPSAEYVKNLLTERQLYFSAFHTNCKLWDDYYHGRNTIALPVGVAADPVRTGSANAIVNVATDHVDVNNLAIDVMSVPRSRARAERIQKFYQGAWLSIKRPVLRTAARHAFIYGIAWLKPMFKADQWPDPPNADGYEGDAEFAAALADWQDKRHIVFPLDCLNVNPRHLVWDDARSGPRWAIEFYESSAGELRYWFPQWQSAKFKDSDSAQWCEYWDERWYGVMVDGDWAIAPYEHNYGFMPYVPVVPGNSIDAEAGPPQERYTSILAPTKDLLDAEGRIFSAYEVILKNYAWPSKTFQGPVQQAQEASDSYEVGPGVKRVLPPNVQLVDDKGETPPQELLLFLQTLQSQVESVTFPNVIRGQRPKGISTGFGVSVLAGMGRLVFQGVADGLARAIEQCNSGFAMLVENKARGPVTVYARTEIERFDETIGPNDIRGLYENRVVLKAEAPEEAERQAILSVQLFQAGLISKYEAQRRARVVNPLEEQVQQRAEQLADAAFPQQAQELLKRLAQAGAAAGGPVPTAPEVGSALGLPTTDGVNTGEFQPGMGQGPRPGEADIQRRRVDTRRLNESVFPQGMEDMGLLGERIGAAGGMGARLPSGGRSP